MFQTDNRCSCGADVWVGGGQCPMHSLTRLPGCPPPAHRGPALAFGLPAAGRCLRGVSLCLVWGQGGGSWCPCPSRGGGGPAGRADWWSCRGPGVLPRDGAPALCVLSILRAPCPRVTKSLLRVSVPSPPEAPGPPAWAPPPTWLPAPPGSLVL